MNDLIVIMGTSGVGKTAVAEYLTTKGITHISFDDIIKELFGKDNLHLEPQEIQTAYEEMGRRVSKQLVETPVAVDEWFYTNKSYEWFIKEIPHNEELTIFHFWLRAPLETILERHSHKQGDKPTETMVREQYEATVHSPGKYYTALHPISIDTHEHTVQQVYEMIHQHILFHHQMKITERLRDY